MSGLSGAIGDDGIEDPSGKHPLDVLPMHWRHAVSLAGFVMGFGDFKSELPIKQVAALLSSHVFGGMRFIEKNVDEDHDVGTLTLDGDFLGIQVDLFGKDGSFTLEIGTRPSASVEGCPDVCDLSEMLKQRLNRIGLVVSPKV